MSETDPTSWLVLVVEDDDDTADLTTSILAHHNVRHALATDGEQALAMIDARKPDVVLLDLALPRLDGWEVLAIIRSKPETQDLCVIALTAYHSARVAEQAIERGFDGYFSKPVNATTFIEEIAAICATRPRH